MASSAVSYAREHQQKFLGELKDLLRIPSVSTAPEHKEDVRRAAMFVADEMRRIGLENVDVIPTRNHPLVYGDWLHAPGKPTVLCYAHYDVQPPDPLNEWLTPPFEPTERNQNIYARGAVDDKGQLWMEIKAVEALMRANNGKLPINVKFIIEGEEEVGGESIAAYVRARKPSLKLTSRWCAIRNCLRPIFLLSASVCADWCTQKLKPWAPKLTCIPACTAAQHPILFSR